MYEISIRIEMSKLDMDSCYSCNKSLSPDKPGSSKFPCPNCGGLIVRCNDCRRLSNNYICPSCEFEGPKIYDKLIGTRFIDQDI